MSEEKQGTRLLRRLLWQRLDTPGMEICALTSSDAYSPNRLGGHVLVALDRVPLTCFYHVNCDEMWNTTHAYVESRIRVSDVEDRRLTLRARDGNWSAIEWRKGIRAEREVLELSGCVDIDIGATPSTNTLPIRRLNLAIGESRELTAAWVRFPELTVEPLAQRYTRLAERRYRYESTASGFTAELEVDDLGLVVSYENLWQRVAESGPVH